MYIAHFGPALAVAARREAPSLAILCVAAQLADLCFFTFSLIGLENFRIVPGITKMMPLDLYDMPLSHSLLGTTIIAILFGILMGIRAPAVHRNQAAVIVGCVVLSHWFLDVIVHRPDMTLIGGPPLLGLGLWNYPLIAMPLELLIFTGGLALYLKGTRAVGSRTPAPIIIFMSVMLAFLGMSWFGALPSSPMGMLLLSCAGFIIMFGVIIWFEKSRRKI
jgi:hypothetical protein